MWTLPSNLASRRDIWVLFSSNLTHIFNWMHSRRETTDLGLDKRLSLGVVDAAEAETGVILKVSTRSLKRRWSRLN